MNTFLQEVIKIGLVLCVSSRVNAEILNTYKYLKLQGCNENYALSDSNIFSVNVSSKVLCSKTCTFTEDCLSFNIKKISHLKYHCELNSRFETASCAHLSSADGFQYYFKVCITHK